MLPPDASADSRRRLALAVELVRRCPPSFASEIAASGSSDLELNLWTTALPPTQERAAWLRSLGATMLPSTSSEPR